MLPKFEDVFLLLVFGGDVADSLLQANWHLVVVGRALGSHLAVFIERQLLTVDHAVHVMPGPAEIGKCLLA